MEYSTCLKVEQTSKNNAFNLGCVDSVWVGIGEHMLRHTRVVCIFYWVFDVGEARNYSAFDDVS